MEDIICDRLPTISMISTDIVDVSVGCGTGIIRHTYYSVSQNRLSEPFEYVVAISNHIVAYIDVSQKSPLEGRKLIIRDIFDRAVYCEEFTFDFSYVDTPVVVAAFDDKGTKLQLTYLAGDEQIETTTLTLNLP